MPGVAHGRARVSASRRNGQNSPSWLGPSANRTAEEKDFWPYLRDEETLARPWAIPGTPGLEHRIGGLEKSDGHGNISYDPANHEHMVHLRQDKVDRIARSLPDLEVDDPAGDARLLVIGWGSTYGPISAAARRVRQRGQSVATVHLRHLNPFPTNLGEILGRYDRIVCPEMNLGQLAGMLRDRYLVDVRRLSSVRGMPFGAEQLEHEFLQHLEEMERA